MRAFALVSDLGGDEAVELFLSEQDAVDARDAALREVPEWVGILHVQPVDLDNFTPHGN